MKRRFKSLEKSIFIIDVEGQYHWDNPIKVSNQLCDITNG